MYCDIYMLKTSNTKLCNVSTSDCGAQGREFGTGAMFSICFVVNI